MNTQSDNTITNKVEQTLNDLLKASKLLRNAIIHRKVNLIWDILAEQGKKTEELEQYHFLWINTFGESDDPEIRKYKLQIKKRFEELRSINESNRFLSQSYLSAIKKALKETGMNIAKKTNVYSRNGKMKLKHASLIINRVG